MFDFDVVTGPTQPPRPVKEDLDGATAAEPRADAAPAPATGGEASPHP